MYRKSCKKPHNGLSFVTFGAGLLVASCFPITATIVILAIVLIILGLMLCKNT